LACPTFTLRKAITTYPLCLTNCLVVSNPTPEFAPVAI